MILRTIHPTNAEQLKRVVHEMQTLGAPKIRVVNCGDHYFALEGTHRIEAAWILRLPVELEVVPDHEIIDVPNMDIAESFDEPVPMPARAVVESLREECNGLYKIAEDGSVQLVKKAKYPGIPPATRRQP